jgi:hypothetical protein
MGLSSQEHLKSGNQHKSPNIRLPTLADALKVPTGKLRALMSFYWHSEFGQKLLHQQKTVFGYYPNRPDIEHRK